MEGRARGPRTSSDTAAKSRSSAAGRMARSSTLSRVRPRGIASRAACSLPGYRRGAAPWDPWAGFDPADRA